MPHNFHILEKLPHTFISGKNFFEQNNTVIDFIHKCVSFHYETTIASISTPEIQYDNQNTFLLLEHNQIFFYHLFQNAYFHFLSQTYIMVHKSSFNQSTFLHTRILDGSKWIVKCENNNEIFTEF